MGYFRFIDSCFSDRGELKFALLFSIKTIQDII